VGKLGNTSLSITLVGFTLGHAFHAADGQCQHVTASAHTNVPAGVSVGSTGAIGSGVIGTAGSTVATFRAQPALPVEILHDGVSLYLPAAPVALVMDGDQLRRLLDCAANAPEHTPPAEWRLTAKGGTYGVSGQDVDLRLMS
jgi:hypothetical protein